MLPLKNTFLAEDYPQLLIGLASPDDSAVYKLDDTRAIISTTDFFPPVVDNPYHFGAIAAANALSDVYAMGGKPLMAINLVAYPDGLDLSILTEIMRGGADKVTESGAVIAGGHTVTDKEPEYGLAVTGEVHPERILRKEGAKAGDVLILTKPLGVGTMTTAIKQGKASSSHIEAVIQGMAHLNRTASEIVQKYNDADERPIHAMTDITGYSLIGHAHEMAHLSHVDFNIQFDSLNWYEGSLEYAQADIFPGGMHRNREYFQTWTSIGENLADWQEYLLYDPQTSGGLLIAASADVAQNFLSDLVEAGENASIIGIVSKGNGRIHVK